MQATDADHRSGETRATAGYVLVASCATLVFGVISFAPQVSVAKYRHSYLFLVPIVWAALALRRRIALLPLHFALFALALVLHDLGAFGWYSRSVLGLQFDWCVHFFFGLVGGSIVARALHRRLGLRGGTIALLTVLVVAGIGAVHEIVEAASTMMLGDQGMLYVGADNPFDSQEDLLSGMVGSLTAVAIRWAGAKRTGPLSAWIE